MELIKPIQHIPNDIVKLLLQFDGRIKYRNGQYVDTIDRNDERYSMLDKLIKKKLKIYYSEYEKDGHIEYDSFIHDIFFENLPYIKLTYIYYDDGDNRSKFYYTICKKKNKTDMFFAPVVRFIFT